MFEGLTILDAHMHYAYPLREESLIETLDITGVDYALLAALPNVPGLDPTPDILAIKARHPSRIFAFGCVNRMVYYKGRRGLSQRLISRTKYLLDAGCDGLKLLEGKPTMRREHPIPDFDDVAWNHFWAFAEKTHLPILWHVNDPQAFWDAKLASAHAKEEGWVYGKDTIQSSEQYRQVRAVLDRFPRLTICFAHLLFLSAQLPRLTEWMERFPNIRLDLTPGIEVYQELSKTPVESQVFLTRFHDRILYGTDTGGRASLSGTIQINPQEAVRRASIVRAFLTQKGERTIDADSNYLIGLKPFQMVCMNLPYDLLKDIFYHNFLRFIGKDHPAPVQPRQAQRLCKITRRALTKDARRNRRYPDLRSIQAVHHSLKTGFSIDSE